MTAEAVYIGVIKRGEQFLQENALDAGALYEQMQQN